MCSSLINNAVHNAWPRIWLMYALLMLTGVGGHFNVCTHILQLMCPKGKPQRPQH